MRIQYRDVFAWFAFFGTFNLYSLRLNLSVAIVDMVNFDRNQSTDISPTTISNYSSVNSVSTYNSTTEKLGTTGSHPILSSTSEKFDWNGNQQGLLLSCYFYGYIVTQVIGAYLGRKFGRVRVLGILTLGSSTLTLLFPTIAKELNFGSVVAVRILIGLLSGATLPILFALINVWAPVSERSRLLSIQFAGSPMGTCVVLPASGFLSDIFGWESVFYATGCFGCTWAFLWLFCIYESPDIHPNISSKERDLILGSQKNTKDNKRSVPWISMVTSTAWIVLAFTHFASLFGKYQLMAMLPSYLKTVLEFDVKSSGGLSSIPFFVGTFVLLVAGPLADYLISRNIKSIYVRKAFSTTGMLISSISLIIVTYVGSSIAAAMILFTLAVAMDSLGVPGFKACLMEITPEFSGIAYGMSNTVSALSGVIAPQITGTLREKYVDEPLTGWRVSFLIGGAVYFAGAMVFLIFGTNEKQTWSYDKSRKEDVEELDELNKK